MTAQRHEYLILDGEMTTMSFCPPLPEGHPRLIKLTPEEFEEARTDEPTRWQKYGNMIRLALLATALTALVLYVTDQPKYETPAWLLFFISVYGVIREVRVWRELRMPSAMDFFRSSACWRGYQGMWEIKDGRFYLAAIDGLYQLRDGDPILADWFSGVLRVPRGEVIQYVHMGYGSVYEEELHIKIEQGMVVDTRVIDNRGKKHDKMRLGWENLPGNESRFSGDDDI